MPDIKASAIIPAAGTGSRFEGSSKKQFVKIQGKPLLSFCLKSFQKSLSVGEIVLVVSRDDVNFVEKEIIGKSSFTDQVKVVEGGDVRQDSVKKGFEAVRGDAKIVVVHDAARPFVTPDFIDKIISEANTKGCVISAIPITDTLKMVNNEIVKNTLSRSSIWRAQTPQAFKCGILRDGYEKVDLKNSIFTDEAQIVECAGHKVHITRGSEFNFKVTSSEDMKLAELMMGGHVRSIK